MTHSADMDNITLVIPVYNRADIIGRTLQAVASQTWRPLNVILVDNNSSDSTLSVLQNWKKDNERPDFCIEIFSEKKPGASAARNCGLSHVRTEWTMFFDSDDIMTPDHVERAMRFAGSHPDSDIIGWDRAINYLSGQRVIRQFHASDCEFHNVFHSIFSTQCYMARTDLFRQAGGWDEAIGMGDDIELGHRMLQLHPKVCKIVGPVTVEVHESARSISTDSGKHIRSFEAAYESIRSRLPEEKKHWVDLRYIVLVANETKCDEESPRFVADILRRTPTPRRWFWKAFYKYSLNGGRGVAKIYKLLRSII